VLGLSIVVIAIAVGQDDAITYAVERTQSLDRLAAAGLEPRQIRRLFGVRVEGGHRPSCGAFWGAAHGFQPAEQVLLAG
jgi:hypothetical protein